MTGNLRYANPLQGTDSTMTFSRGNTLPLVAVPWGMNAWVQETFDAPRPADGWFFSPHHRTTRGIRCSHQPSPWNGDYACFRLLPQAGPPDFTEGGLSSSFSPERTTIEPAYFATRLHRFEADVSLAPTQRGAVFATRFAPGTARARLVLRLVHGRCRAELAPDGRTVLASFYAPNHGVRDDLEIHVAVRSSVPVAELVRFGAGVAGAGSSVAAGSQTTEGPEAVTGAAIELDWSGEDGGRREVVFHIATSYIGGEQAITTLEREVAPHTVAGAREAAEALWEERFSRLEIATRSEEARRTFYSCLYRALLFPNMTHEVAGDGSVVHRSFYDGSVQPGPMVTNNGFWDTYRTVYPFLSLVYPKTLGTILTGWVNASREGLWTPKWPGPGHRGTMIGTHLDAVFADAWMKRIDGWDAREAYRIARRNAFEVPPSGAPYGRVGLDHYLELGYVPEEIHHGASRTLDFAYGDFCLAQMADEFAPEDAPVLRERAGWWHNIYDATTGFLRGRRADGEFAPGFDPCRWGGPYVEGSAWQCGLAVYHEPLELGRLMAGGPDRDDRAARSALEAHLDALINADPRFDSGAYPGEIHEMSEVAAVDFGQYAHSNQPSHHIPFLYAHTDRPWKADHIVRSVLEQLYDSSPQGFCGDEDNGEMSAWYLLASMGLYQVCPGRPEYTLTGPLFEEMVVRPEEGEPLRIVAPGSSTNARYVAGVTMNGTQVGARQIGYAALREGGTLSCAMRRMPVASVPTVK